jgi:hypothetical protein
VKEKSTSLDKTASGVKNELQTLRNCLDNEKSKLTVNKRQFIDLSKKARTSVENVGAMGWAEIRLVMAPQYYDKLQ